MKKKDGFSGQRTLVLPDFITHNLEHEMITSALFVTDIGYYPHAKYHYRSRENGIEQHILLYCIKGSGWVETEGRRTRITGNQLVVLPAGIPHRYGSDEADPWSIYWLHFKGSHAQFYARRMLNPLTFTTDGASGNETRIGLFEDIYRTLETGYSIENLYNASLSLQYFFCNILFKASAEENLVNASDPVSRCIYFMTENIEQKLGLEDLAAFVHYSGSHLSSMFKRKTGYAPIDYFIALKIQKACQYLDTTKMKVNQICPKIGIDDPLYFSRIFRRRMGISPSDYRKKEKG